MYRILVPVDTDTERAIHQAEYVIDQPGDAADVEVTVIHVHEADYQGAAPQAFEDNQAATTVVERIEAAGIPSTGELVRGMIAKTIVETADEYDVDQIVMAGRKRSGVAKVLIGSVTQDVMLSTERPVVVLG